MFRRGGFIYAPLFATPEQMAINPGATSLQILKGPGGMQFDNLHEGDKIAIFDSGWQVTDLSDRHTFEDAHDEAFIGSPIDRTTDPNYATITLVTTRGGSASYHTQFAVHGVPLGCCNPLAGLPARPKRIGRGYRQPSKPSHHDDSAIPSECRGLCFLRGRPQRHSAAVQRCFRRVQVPDERNGGRAICASQPPRSVELRKHEKRGSDRMVAEA